MKCGLMYQFSTGGAFENGGVASVYAEQLDQITLVDALGFDDLWLSEHHFTESNYLPSPLVMAGAVAMRTRRCGVGIGIAAVPFYNPLRLAEDCAVADNLCDGRLMLGVGIGYREDEYTGYCFPRRERVAYLEEAIEVIRGAWGPEPFSHEGRHFYQEDVNCTPKPVRGHIPIWVSGGTPAAIRRAARLGDGWFANNIDAAQLETYRGELDAAGKDSGAPPVAALPFAWIYVSEDPERDWAVLGPHAIREINLFAGWSVPGLDLQTVEQVQQIGLVNVLTPEQAVEKISSMHASTPLQRFVFIPNLRGAPVDLANRSLELFADRVLPKVHAFG